MNRVKIILFLIFVGFLSQINAQKKGTIGFSFSALNTNQMLQYAAENHDYTTVEGRGFLSFSADYWYPVNDWLEFETGVNYSLQGFAKTISNKVENGLIVPLDYSENIDYHLINIPIGVRAEFLDFGFVNGGLLVDIAQQEPGIGSYFGFGVKLDSYVGYGIFINPYVKMHSILPINFNYNADRILEAGIRIGVTYSLDNKFTRR